MSKRLILALVVSNGAAIGASWSAFSIARVGVISPLEMLGRFTLTWAVGAVVAYWIFGLLAGDRLA